MKSSSFAAAALATTVALSGVALADTSGIAAQCQKQGFTLVVGADGTRFATSGACTAYVARGGLLQPGARVQASLRDVRLDTTSYERPATVLTLVVVGGEAGQLYGASLTPRGGGYLFPTDAAGSLQEQLGFFCDTLTSAPQLTLYVWGPGLDASLPFANACPA